VAGAAGAGSRWAEPVRWGVRGRLVADDITVGDLSDVPGVDEQVDVPDHLGEGEEGLRHRHVAPDRLGELVTGPRLLGDQPVELLRPPLVHREAGVDQGDMARDGLAVAGEHDLRGQLPRSLQRLQIGDERLGPLSRPVQRPRDQGVRGDVLDQMVGGEQDPSLAVPEHRVGGAMARTVLDLQAAIAEIQQLAVVQRAAHLDLGSPGTEAAGHLAQCPDHLLGDPVASHQRRRLLVVALGIVAEVLEEGNGEVDGRHLGSRAVRDDVDQPEMVDVLVGDDDQLEVLDPMAEGVQLALQLVERLAGVGSRVDQGERVVLEQVGVDPADLKRGGDPEQTNPRLGYPLPGLRRNGVIAHDRISPRTSSRLASMSFGETSDSRLRRSRGSVFEGRTLKCQSG
jgi:hypothetical protein